MDCATFGGVCLWSSERTVTNTITDCPPAWVCCVEPQGARARTLNLTTATTEAKAHNKLAAYPPEPKNIRS